MQKDNRILRITIHVLACTCFLIFPYLFWHGPMHEEKNLIQNPFLRNDMIGYVFLIGFFYLNYYLLIPRLYFTKKFTLFWLLVFLSVVFIAIVPKIISFGLFPLPPEVAEYMKPFRPAFLLHHFEHQFLRFAAVFILSLLLRINDQWKTAQKDKMSAELSYMRAQINPHFLFNTLNSIYSMAISKSDHTATAVVKLSGMMRYAITDAHMNLVPLQKEISYISDYIDLQQYRLGNTVKLNYRINGDPEDKKIAPLILISIVENAFKYGVNPEENSSIMVDLTIHEYFLVFIVKNNKVRTNVSEDEKSGIGIENTRKRLEMIYPGRHKFEIEETAREFSVVLTLQLS